MRIFFKRCAKESENLVMIELFKAMLAEMSDEDKAKIQAMLDSGMSMNDVLKHFTGINLKQ